MGSALKRHPALAPAGPDHWFSVDTPAGRVFVAVGEDGISMIAPARDFDAFAGAFSERVGRRLIQAEASDHPEVAAALERGEAAPELCDLGVVSPFTRRVLAAASSIERGQTRTYQWLAAQIGMPRAARAVGNALGANPVPIAIPCHRVVRSDGTLGGYAFGLEMKRTLLAAEGGLIYAAA